MVEQAWYSLEHDIRYFPPSEQGLCLRHGLKREKSKSLFTIKLRGGVKILY